MNRTIILFDLENIRFSLKNRGLQLDLGGTRQKILALGHQIVAQVAFADFQFGVYDKQFQRELRNAGFIMVQCPLLENRSQHGKATDDDELMNFINFLIGSNASFDTVLLGSGDGNFLRAAQLFQNQGKKVCRVNSELLDCSSDLKNCVVDECNVLAVQEFSSEAVANTSSRPTVTQMATPKIQHASVVDSAIVDYFGGDNEDSIRANIARHGQGRFNGTLEHDLQLMVFLTYKVILKVFAYQNSIGRACSFVHMLNMLQDSESRVCLAEHGSPHQQAKLNRTDHQRILEQLKESGVIHAGPVTDQGKEINGLILNTSSSFHQLYSQGLTV